MMQDYNKILDRVYELEGLVLLAISGDNKTARLPELIYMKAFEITELAMPKPQPPTTPSAAPAPQPPAEPVSLPAAPSVEAPSAPQPPGAPSAEPPSAPLPPVAPSAEAPSSPQPPAAPSAEAPVALAPVRSRFAPVAGREPEPLAEREPEPSSKPEPSPAPASSKKPSFSLNDHFLFIRELFGGDAEEFNRAMNNLASLDSFDEAEEFFFAEYDWDSESETTQSFMNCIFNYFNIAPSSK